MELIKMLEEKNIDLTTLFSINEEVCFVIETDVGGADIGFYIKDDDGEDKELFRADLGELKYFVEKINAFIELLEGEIKLEKIRFEKKDGQDS